MKLHPDLRQREGVRPLNTADYPAIARQSKACCGPRSWTIRRNSERCRRSAKSQTGEHGRAFRVTFEADEEFHNPDRRDDGKFERCAVCCSFLDACIEKQTSFKDSNERRFTTHTR